MKTNELKGPMELNKNMIDLRITKDYIEKKK